MKCPVCKMLIPDGGSCPNCKTDLSDYSSVYFKPDALFNEAVDRMKLKAWAEAVELLAAAHSLRPDDMEILVTMARCESFRGNHAAAIDLLDRAFVIGEIDSELAEFYRTEESFC